MYTLIEAGWGCEKVDSLPPTTMECHAVSRVVLSVLLQPSTLVKLAILFAMLSLIHGVGSCSGP